MSEYRKVLYKPGDEDNTYIILSSDGRLLVFGDVADPEVDLGWSSGSKRDIARDFVVIDWDGPSGYILSGFGNVEEFGAVTPVPNPGDVGAPPYTRGGDLARGIVMNPLGNGQGYQLRADGLVSRFGPTLPADIGAGPGSSVVKNGAAVDVVAEVADWGSGMRFYVLDQYGKIWPCNGAHSVRNYTGETSGWSAIKYMRSIDVYDWDGGQGYVMDVYGRVFSFADPDLIDPPKPASKPNWRKQGWAVARDFHIVNISPFEYKLFTSQGATHTVFVSSPPEIEILSPVDESVETDTHAPAIEWSYVDPDGDKPGEYRIHIYTDEQHDAEGFDPWTTTPLQTERIMNYRQLSWVPDDLANGVYHAYVMAIEDVSGFRSNTAHVSWTQDVELLDAPTVVVTQDDPMSHKFVVEWPHADYDVPALTAQVMTATGWSDALRGRTAFLTGDPLTVTEHYWEPGQMFDTQYRFRIYDFDNPDSYTEWLNTSGTTWNGMKTWFSVPGVNGSAKEMRISERTEEHPIVSGTFLPIGQAEPITIIDEHQVKAAQGEMTIQLLDSTELENFYNIFLLDRVVLMRDQFGKVMYFTVSESIKAMRMKLAALPYELTTIRNATEVTFSYREVKRPS